MTANQPDGEWPSLPLDSWRDTYATLHMWTQIAGKICLALTPLTNHYWNITFHVGARGLSTQMIGAGDKAFTMTFDFIEHRFDICCADGRTERIALEPRTVADFYAAVMAAMKRLGIKASIWPVPVEVPDPIRFDEDTLHRSYDPDAAATFWRVLLAITPVLEAFRARFIGKCSPVHFFWGSFDLAVTRFSGRRAPERQASDKWTGESYSHEVISHGFWPGSGPVQDAAFYAYAAPEPDGLKEARVEPAAAYYHREMSEFILPYDAVRTSASPAAELTRFLESTYARAADLAAWDRAALERV
jgi:hypothetical protein